MNLFERATMFPDRTAVITKDGSYTYAQLLRDSGNLAKRLLGSKSGDLREARVSFLCAPGYEYAVAQWAIWRAGGIAVPLCTTHPVPEMQYVLDDSQSQHLLSTPEFAKTIQSLSLGSSNILIDHIQPSPSFAVGSSDFEETKLSNDRGAMIIYTSGTTGKPKGVVSSHGNVEAQVTSLVDAWEWTKEDRILHVLPLHHVHGVINVLTCALWSGATCEFMHPFDAKKIWQRFVDGGVTMPQLSLFMAVPTIYSKLIQEYDKMSAEEQSKCTEAAKRLRLMVSGSAALPEPIMDKWRSISGHTLLERYGMTEIGMALSNPLRGTRVPGAVGTPLPNVEAKIMKDNETEAKEGEEGELWIKGPAVFKEYFNRPEATAKSFQDGYFLTGDISVQNKGIYRILGRASVDILKSGGYKISALDIETDLLQHPAIREVAVIGVKDAEWGQRIAAIIALNKSHPEAANFTLESLRNWSKERMAHYKAPTLLKLVDEIPRNAMGKVNKKELLKIFFPESA